MAETKKSLADMSMEELAAIPVEGDALLPGAKQARDRRQQTATERAEREAQYRVLGGTPPAEAPIPGDVLQQATLHRLASVETTLQHRQRCQADRTRLAAELAEAVATHQRNRTARAEAHAGAIVEGKPPRGDDGADRRETETIRELEGRVDAIVRAEQQLERQARTALALEVKTGAWPAQRRLRREGLEQMLEGCRLLAAAQERIQAAERAGLHECTRVRRVLQLELGPATRVTPGAAIERPDPRDRNGRAVVTVGREPDRVEQLDEPATAIIRRYFEGYLGVSAVPAASWFHRLAPGAVLETITLLERELATLAGKE